MDGCGVHTGDSPHYIKCYDAITETPLNHRRVQYPSQESTTGIDPTIPQMNITDTAACLRMHI